MIYEQVKQKILSHRVRDHSINNATSKFTASDGGVTRSQSKELLVKENLFCAAIAAAGAAWITTPLDLVKMRLQVQRSAKHSSTGTATPFQYRHFCQGLTHILSTEGFVGCFRGAVPRCLYHTPTVAVTMVVMSHVRDSFLNG